MSRHFKNNSGHIESKNKDAFIALVEKIEAYNSASCEKSHKKCVEKRAAKVVEKAKISISFEDYCDDMLDISFDLLSREEKTATRNAYRGLVA